MVVKVETADLEHGGFNTRITSDGRKSDVAWWNLVCCCCCCGGDGSGDSGVDGDRRCCRALLAIDLE